MLKEITILSSITKNRQIFPNFNISGLHVQLLCEGLASYIIAL